VPTPEGGTHEAGLRTALTRGLKAYAELSGNKRAAVITTEDVMISAGIMLSVFMREPEFRARRRRSSPRARPAHCRKAVSDHFDHWLTGHPAQGRRCSTG
jgi:topoisomerase-4 subunit B